MKDVFKALFKEEDWAWDDLAEALIEEYGKTEATEIISSLLCRSKSILSEVCSWKNVEELVKNNLLKEMLERK